MQIGTHTLVIVDGWIPPTSKGPKPDFVSHDTVCIVNAGETYAHIELLLIFCDRAPAGPYRITVPRMRTHHQRFNDLTEPEPVPVATDFSCVVHSDQPVVVQQTRLDSRQAENALFSTIAYPAS